MASDSVSYRDWANLPRDILTLIGKRLSAAVDYANFSAVCTSWASIASPSNGMPRPLSLRKNQPYLLFSGDGVGNCEESDFCSLFDYLDNSSQRIHPLPEIRGKWFVGSQFGWLAVIDEFSNPSLLNPFTRSQIELPPITATPDVDPVYDSEGSLTGYNCCGDYQYYPLDVARAALVFKKLVLSSDPTHGDFVAMAISGPYGNLMFTRPGEKKWNPIKSNLMYPIVDVIHRDGEFFAVTNSGDVYVIDLSSPFSLLDDSLVAKGYGTSSLTRYLVDSSGLLLHIWTEHDFFEEFEEESRKTCEIDIRSLDPETGKWLPVNSLGDRSLFIGTWCSTSLPAGEISGLKENCVYFTDDYWQVIPADKDMVRNIGMFNLTPAILRLAILGI